MPLDLGFRICLQNDKPSPGRGDQKIAQGEAQRNPGKNVKMKMSPVRGGISFSLAYSTNLLIDKVHGKLK